MLDSRPNGPRLLLPSLRLPPQCGQAWPRGQLRLMSDDTASRVERQARKVFVIHLRTAKRDGAPASHHVVIDNRSDEPIRQVELLFLARITAMDSDTT